MNAFVDAVEEAPPFLDVPQQEPVPKVRPWYATQSQQAGLQRLDALADLFVRVGDSTPGSFRPLLKPLIVGATGTGKSSLATEFARRRGWAFLAVDAGSWIIQGSAPPKPPTLKVIRDHIRSSERTCVFVDETCKMLPHHDSGNAGWYSAVFSECLALCDGDSRLIGHGWRQDDVAHMRESCFLIFGGAFSAALREARLSAKRGGLGFVQAPSQTTSHSSKIGECLPDELFNRFNGDHVVLQAPTRQDYARGIEMIHEDIGVERETPIKELLDRAEASQNGVRWLTEYLTAVLLANPEALPARMTKPAAPKPLGYDFFTPDAHHYCRLVTTESFNLRGALGRLLAEMYKSQDQIAQGSQRTFANYFFGESGDRLQVKLLEALCAANSIGDITSDDSAVVDPLMEWRQIAWDGLRIYPTELTRYGMLALVTETWDLTTRVSDLRIKISGLVAAGRFAGGQSS